MALFFTCRPTKHETSSVSASFRFGETQHRGLYFPARPYGAYMKTRLLDEARALPIPERIELVQAIWDSIAESPEPLPLDEAQIAELERRLVEYQQNPEAGSTWEEVKERIAQ